MKTITLTEPITLRLPFTRLSISNFDLPLPGVGEAEAVVEFSATRSANQAAAGTSVFNATLYFQARVTIDELNTALGMPWKQAAYKDVVAAVRQVALAKVKADLPAFATQIETGGPA